MAVPAPLASRLLRAYWQGEAAFDRKGMPADNQRVVPAPVACLEQSTEVIQRPEGTVVEVPLAIARSAVSRNDSETWAPPQLIVAAVPSNTLGRTQIELELPPALRLSPIPRLMVLR